MQQQLVQTVAAGVEGVDGFLVQVEVSRSEPTIGVGRTSVVGLPDASVREAIDRITPALISSGLAHRGTDHVVVNLAPADRRKEGAAFDLAIALGLAATVTANRIDTLAGDTLFLAELALDGRLRPVRGVLACALAAKAAGLKRMVVAPENAQEAAVVNGLSIHAPTSLAEVTALVRSNFSDAVAVIAQPMTTGDIITPDLNDVRGQEHAKRAIAIAAAGQHNLIFIGPPGSGKTMLARRLPGILPPMTLEEALDVTRVHSVSGLLHGGGLLRVRPYRSPHHNVSSAGLIGGGPVPRPGEVSLAHHGVLFLDELPEFSRSTLETLRQPLEDGYLTISRAGGRLRFPSRCMLIAAMNPCPCGYLGHPTRRCTCSSDAVHRYRNKISGPLLDRIDLHLEVPAQRPEILAKADAGEDSATVRARVVEARERMQARQNCPNALLTPKALAKHAKLGDDAQRLLTQAVEELGLSARAFDRILKVARTIADLAARETVSLEDVSEAVGFRVLDRPA